MIQCYIAHAGVPWHYWQPCVQRAERQAGLWREQQRDQGEAQRHCAGALRHRLAEGEHNQHIAMLCILCISLGELAEHMLTEGTMSF